eukprot:GHVH01004655.1.p1 GENE.GHVH01004655.1~~GHVH01004655.1.p1  ORF type:complete len:106 (+),score=13.23 GHVH01004655.1:73-390(+)
MSDVHTTVKTSQCSFSEFNIYPGKGVRYCARDGKVHTYLNHRMNVLQTVLKRKALKLTWSQQWRVAHKKGRQQEAKRKIRKTHGKKQVRAIFGVSVDEIKKRVAQ